uniref:receptor protein-tyrosine kinase n=1 Tax=Plectus sambesii TaxID=2011161 RepID=A0A914VB91_9BILA
MTETPPTNDSGEEIYEQIPFESVDVDYLPYDDGIELSTDRLRKLPVCLGEGHYGEVWLGCLVSNSGYVKETVAIKMPRSVDLADDELKSERKAIRDELKILMHIGKHENILELKGALTKKKDHFWMALEYCELGSLEKYLREKRKQLHFIDEIVKHADNSSGTIYKAQIEAEWQNDYVNRKNEGFVTTSDLLLFGLQIANGMDFLHEKGIVHRDLALRNILLDLNYTVKIADFGLSRRTRNGYYSRTTKHQAIPLFWTAPEALKNSKVLLESDWWTFGVVLWELFELSGTPYAGISGRDLVDKLDSDYRLPQPKYSPLEIYRLMLSLWNLEPRQRTSLTACQQIIRGQLKASCPSLVSGYVQLPPPDIVPVLPAWNRTYFQGRGPEVAKKDVFVLHSGSEKSEREYYEEFRTPKKCCDSNSFCCRFCSYKRMMIAALVVLLLTLTSVGIWLYFDHRSSQEPQETITDISTTATPLPTANEGDVIVQWQGNTYMWVRSELMWKAAEDRCKKWGGHLASIRSKEENDFIQSVHEGNWSWIGYNDINVEGTFSWIDGSDSTFTAWSPDQPNDAGKGEDCVVQQDIIGDWFDDECYNTWSFICKR